MNGPKTDWLALGASICHEPILDVEAELRREHDDLEPDETEFQRGPKRVEDTRREELAYWRRS